MAQLAEHVPIREFIDHGPNLQPDETVDAFLRQKYSTLYGKSKHTVVKAGSTIPINGLDLRVVTSAGESIKKALPGAAS